MDNVFDVEKIMEMLPHRYPFLLIDRIIELVPDKRVVAIKNVTFNEPQFQGHFPGSPVMPGVLIIEAMAQAGGVLAVNSSPFKGKKNDLIYFMSIDKVRFRQPVVPGDQIVFKIEVLKLKTKVAKIRGEAFVDDNLVAEAELMALIGEKE